MNELHDIIEKSTLPNSLKDYLLNSKSIKEALNLVLINEIEELYIYFNALYVFDKSEFSAHTITALKRCKNLDTFYYYLKKVLETNLVWRSKDKKFLSINEYNMIKNSNVDKTFKIVVKEYEFILEKIIEKRTISVIEISKIQGKLELINELVSFESYQELLAIGTPIIKHYLKT